MSRGMDGDLPEINDPLPVILKPNGPQCRKPIRSEDSEANGCLTYSPEELPMKSVPQKPGHICENGASSDNASDDDKQMTNNIDEELEEKEFLNYSVSKSPNHSRTTSPERLKNSKKNKSSENSWKKSPTKEREKTEKSQLSSNEQNTNSFLSWIIVVIVVVPAVLYFILSGKSDSTRGNQTEPTTIDRNSFKLIQDIKSKFYSQDSHIWDEISSGINEVKTRTPKVPSIILLFANETHTMDCLALALAHLSSDALGGDSPLNLNPENFGTDPGEIIDYLKRVSAKKRKKAVIIRDVLNINAEAIKALHNLCDRINPLIREVIYIITMQTKNYESSQQKMAFVEKHFYHKLSKSIDGDVLTALVTRITDGAIIFVQSEPTLRYC